MGGRPVQLPVGRWKGGSQQSQTGVSTRRVPPQGKLNVTSHKSVSNHLSTFVPKVFRTIFFGGADFTAEYNRGKSTNATKHGLLEVNPESIVYSLVHVSGQVVLFALRDNGTCRLGKLCPQTPVGVIYPATDSSTQTC